MVAYHRMLVGGGPGEARQTRYGPSQNDICSVRAWKRKKLSFVLHSAGCEHHHLSNRRMFTHVVEGRVGVKDTCYFLRYVET